MAQGIQTFSRFMRGLFVTVTEVEPGDGLIPTDYIVHMAPLDDAEIKEVRVVMSEARAIECGLVPAKLVNGEG